MFEDPLCGAMSRPEHVFYFEEDVPASPADVFAVITDLSMAGVLSPSIVATEPLNDLPFGVGFRWRETRRMFLVIKAKADIEVTHYAPEADVPMYAVLIDDGCNHVTGEFHLTPIESGTRVVYTGEAHVYAKKTKAREPSPKMAKMIQKFDKKCLPRLGAHFRGEL